MTEFTQMERRVLAVLEEAGEENLAALFNTVRRSDPSAGISEYGNALIRLLSRRLIELASARDQSSRQWVPFDFDVALSHLEQLNSLLAWSTATRIWTWNSTTPRTEVLLTDSGSTAAKNVLSEDGWPGAD